MTYAAAHGGSPDRDFFNDPIAENDDDSTAIQPDEITSKLKRTACVLCRKRKLKCDAARPKCATCARLGHDCEYNEVRKKSGPKRGYVKALEARLSQVETQLKTANGPDSASAPNGETSTTNFTASLPGRPANRNFDLGNQGVQQNNLSPTVAPAAERSWDMISTGLEEPLPTQEVQDELHDIYFRKIHPTCPMIHKARFYSSLNQAAHLRPPVCLRYAMWTLACSASDAYADMGPHFYRRSRKYMELDEMRGYGENVMSVWHCQTSILLSIYEFKNMHFPRAWLSTGRAVRLSQMLGLHRLDGAGLEVKQCVAPPNDWTEKEERVRTFWMVFWEDRCASIGTGWPMSIDEQDIMTNLPASETAYQTSMSEPTPSLDDALKGNVANISSFAGAIMLTSLFGRNLLHLHRPTNDEKEHDLNGPFWRRHRAIDSTLLSISLNMPDRLRIPRGLPDPNVMFMNMSIHTSVICLHQAAIFKVDRNKLPANIGQESKIRCVTAAAEIANIMRSISHCDLGTMNPFSAFCLYVASRVFVQYLKSRRGDQQILGSLHFLLSAMHALKRKTPLAESFLAQLDVDLEGAGIPTSYGSSIEALRKKGFPPMKHHRPSTGPNCGRPGAGLSPEGSNGSFSGRDSSSPRDASDGSGPYTAPTGGWDGQSNGELRAPGNRMAPFRGAGNWEHTKTRPGDPLGEMSWGNSTEHGFVQPLSNSSNSRQASVDQMDLSPTNSGDHSTPSMQTHRSGSSAHTTYTPPQSEGSTDQQNNQSQMFPSQAGSGFGGYDDNQPAGFVTFKDYPPAIPDADGRQVFGVGGPAAMSQQEFESLTKSFLPPTPGGELESWGGGMDMGNGTSSGTGLTPAPGEDWTQILDNMTWDGQNNNPTSPWATGQGN